MGQQQLLLIVLGVIVIGIAILVGLDLFQANAVERSRDQVTLDVMALATNAMAYYKKPQDIGGGGNSFIGWDIPEYFKKYEGGKIRVRVQTNKDRVVLVGRGVEKGSDGVNPVRIKLFVYSDDIQYKLLN